MACTIKTGTVVTSYRDFTLRIQQYGRSGNRDGMAQGLGTVVFSGGSPKATAGEIEADLKRRLDDLYDKGLGVFATAKEQG